jgi:putative oxidoreductase
MSAMPQDLQSIGLVWLRVLVGWGIATHGFGKIVGGHMEGFTAGVAQMGLPVPAVLAWAAALSELVGGACLAAGLATRVAASFIFITMSVALFIHHATDPFNVKELAYLYWAASGAFIVTGGGRYGVERLLGRRR